MEHNGMVDILILIETTEHKNKQMITIINLWLIV